VKREYDSRVERTESDRDAGSTVAMQNSTNEYDKHDTFSELILNTIPSAVFTVDHDCRVTSWNRRAETITGYSSDEILGKHCSYFAMEPCSTRCGLCSNDVVKPVVGKTCTIKNKQGAVLTISKNVDVLLDDNGRAVGGIECFEDITERIKTEEALIASNERFKNLSEIFPETIYESDLAGTIVYANKHGMQQFGYTEDDVHQGLQVIDLVQPDDRQHVQKRTMEKLHGIDHGYLEYKALRKDGTTFDAIGLSVAIMKNGAPVGFRGFVLDITKRKQVEDKLKESEDNFRTFFDTVDDLIFVGNRQGVIFHTNDAVSKKLGYTKNDLQGMHVLDVHPKEKRAEAEQIFGDMFAGRRNSCPLPLARKDGSYLPVETRVWFGKWDGKDCIFGISKDLSTEQAAYDKFHKMFDNNPALMAVSTMPDRRFVEVNHAFLNKLGYRKEEIIGKTAQELGLFIQNEKQIEAVNQLQKEGRITNIELKVRKKDGQIMDGLFSGEIIDNQIEKSFLTVMTDISEQRSSAEALLRSESKHKAMVAGISDVIGIMDQYGMMKYKSPNIEKWFGWLPEDLVDTNGWETVHPDDVGWLKKEFQKILSEDNATTTVEYRYKCKDGSYKMISLTATNLVRNEYIRGVLLNYHDITERRKLQNDLKNSEKRLNEAQKMAHVGNWELDLMTGRMWGSEESFAIYGIERDSPYLPLKVVQECVCAEFREGMNRALTDLIAGTSSYDMGYKIKNKTTQEERFVHSTAKLIMNEYNQAIKVGGTIQDVTRQKLVEAELIHAKELADAANVAKSQFLANMSHEIRTPMNGIFGFLELLQTSSLSSDQKEYIREAKTASVVLLNLINDILDFSKIEAGKLTMEKISFNLRTAVEDAVSLLAPKAAEKNLEIHVMIKASVPEEVMGDPSRIRQVLNNLVSNAVKFTEKGEVVITVDAVEQENEMVKLTFTVKDTGIGIKKEAISNLFQSFSQADASTTRKYGGTGLGLAISKELVSMMGGEITVDSIYGEGSVFSFHVCLKITKRASEQNAAYKNLDGVNVLLVDDNASNLRIVGSYLRGAGLHAFEAKDAGHAITTIVTNAISNNRINVAVIDYQMPGMSGLDLATTIKSMPLANEIKLILLTSAAQKGDSRTAQEHGFSGYLTKPVRRDDLLKCIAIVLGLENDDEGYAQMVTRFTVKEVSNALKPKILLVEDNEMNRKIVTRILESQGFSCDAAVDGQEAYSAVQKIRYDIVFMDCQMPVMDGYECTSKIREYEGDKKHTNIIAMTANAMEGDSDKCIVAGMDDYISKPIDYEKMFRLIRASTKQSE